MAVSSWVDAAAYYEGLVADGNRDGAILSRLIERAGATDLVELAEVVAWADSLAVTPTGRPYAEGEPFVLVWSDDEWPYFGVQLQSGRDGPTLASWSGEGEEAAIEVIRELVAWLRGPMDFPPAVPEPQPGFGA